jgi:hypothetical protein
MEMKVYKINPKYIFIFTLSPRPPHENSPLFNNTPPNNTRIRILARVSRRTTRGPRRRGENRQ